jgi:cephalosporin hydroxylase
VTYSSNRFRKLTNPVEIGRFVRFSYRRLLNQLQQAELKLLAPFIVNHFHRLWYSSPATWRANQYFGYGIWQLPLDMQLYQELIFREKPAFILQTGVAMGGSLLYFAHLLDLMGADSSAIVVGIDIHLSDQAKTLNHPRIRMIQGSSTAPTTLAQVERLLPSPTGLVSLDSAHHHKHVLQELILYSQYTAPNCHLVCEDTSINGHPLAPQAGPGPYEAVSDFLKTHPNWIRDDALWKRNLISFHQYGWLKRLN